MSSVWVVTDGAYSDYGIKAVFDTLEAAREYAELHEYDIETWALNDPSVGQVVRSGYEVYCSWANSRTGYKWSIIDRGWEHWDATRDYPIQTEPDWPSFAVLGKDRDHAYKIAHDRIAEAKARAAGLT